MADIESKMGFDGTEVVKGMQQIGESVDKVSAAVDSLVKHFEKLEALDLSKISKNVTNIKVPKTSEPTVVSSQGYMTSPSGSRNKKYKEYQQAVIDAQLAEIEEIKARTAKEKKLTESLEKSVELENKKINETSKRTAAILSANENAKRRLDETSKWRAYREEHPEMFVAGGLWGNKKYQASKALNSVANKVGSIGIGADKLEGRLIGGVLDTVAGALKSPAAMASTGISALVNGLTDLSKASVKAYADIEATKTQLGVVFQNQTQANTTFTDIAQYSVKSPFGVQETSELAVLLKQSGVYATDLMDTLKMLGDTAGGNMEKMKRIANNYAQIVSIGKASMLDMRQFAYAGIPIFEAVSNELGVSQSRLRELISQGKVTSDIIKKVFKDLTGVNGVFKDATEKGAKTLKARLQNLSDSKQLALASIGESIYKKGSVTGGDSFGASILATTENIYSHLHDYVNTKNITSDIKIIANRESKRKQLEELKEYNKIIGNKDAVKLIEQQLKDLDSSKFIESDRATKELKYLNIEARFKEASDLGFELEETKSKDLLIKINNLLDKKERLEQKQASIRNTLNDNAEAGLLDDFTKKELLYPIESLSIEIAELDTQLKGLRKAAKALKELTPDLIQSHKESNLLAAQQLDFDRTNSKAKETSSLNTLFEELVTMQYNSEEEKKKREEEHIKALKDAQQTMKDLSKKADEKGHIDLSKLTMGEYLDYRNRGAFKAGSKLDVVPSNASPEQKAKSREEFSSNINWAAKEISSALSDLGYEKQSKKIVSLAEKLINSKTDELFFKNTASTMADIKKILNELKEKVKTDKEREVFDNYETVLNATTHRQEVANGGDKVNVEKELKKGQDFVPLWKRILAQSTGVSANTIVTSQQALSLYKDEVFPRKLAKDIFSSMLKNGSSAVNIAELLSWGNGVKLRGTNSDTTQLDWKKVGDNLEAFALQLRTTTDYISSYKSALQQQYDTYVELLAGGVTTSETQDIKEQKFITPKQYEKIVKDQGEQFVNAFSAGLKNKEGKSVFYVQEGVAYGDGGIKLQNQELVFTEKMYSILSKELPNISRKLDKANESELQSSVLENSVESLKSTMVDNAVVMAALKNRIYGKAVENNKDAVKKYANDALSTKLKELTNKESVSKEDINEALLNGTLTTADISESIITALNTVINSSAFISAINGEKGASLNARELEFINKVMNFAPDRSVTATKEKGVTELEKRVFSSLGLSNVNLKNIDYDELNASRRETRDSITAMERKLPLDKYTKFSESEMNTLKTSGASDSQLQKIGDPNTPYQERLSILEEIKAVNADITEDSLKQKIAQEGITQSMKDFGKSVQNAAISAAEDTFVAPFKEVGKYLVTGSMSASELASNIGKITANMMEQVGVAMTTCGFQIAGNAAVSQSWGLVAAGLGLAAAGGVVGGMGSALSSLGDSESDTNSIDKENEDRLARLESLRSDLLDILKQAKEDADYYENNLRHKKALSLNQSLGADVKVNDAIITPSGNVISTHPDDYLIATKTPQTLVGSGSVAPKVNFKFIDKSTGIRIASQKEEYNERTNSIDLSIEIENKISEFISTSKGDDAFNARAIRLNGMSYTG